MVRLHELLATDGFPEREPAASLRDLADEVDLGLAELSRIREIRRRCSAVLHSADVRSASDP